LKKYYIFILALLLGIHGPLFGSTSTPEGSSKDVSKKHTAIITHANTRKLSSVSKSIPCGRHFMPYQHGVASWYGPGFQGKPMANTKPFDMRKDTVAHLSLKLGTKICVANLSNGKSVVATVTDRGPYKSRFGPYKSPRIIDVSKAIAIKLGFADMGTTKVSILVYRG